MKGAPLTAAHRALAETHLDVARRAAGAARKRVPASMWDDILGAAYEGLCAAARDWNADLDPNFAKYAWFRCDHAIGDELRRQTWFGRRAQENGAERPAGPAALDYLLDGTDVEAEAVHAHLCGHVRHAALALRPVLRRVYARVYVDGAQQADVAAELGVSASRVSQLCRQLQAELRRVVGAAA